MKTTIGIVDYGCGNFNSLKSVLRNINYNCIESKSIKQLDKTDLLILPGVGSFSHAAKNLRKSGLDKFLKKIHKKKPILGICLGMQLFANIGYEKGKNKGLGIIPGKVEIIKEGKFNIGWKILNSNNKDSNLNRFSNKYFYFNHGYKFKTLEKYIYMKTSIKNKNIPTVIRKKNILGVQFHPEKSQLNGKVFLKTIIENLLDGQ